MEFLIFLCQIDEWLIIDQKSCVIMWILFRTFFGGIFFFFIIVTNPIMDFSSLIFFRNSHEIIKDSLLEILTNWPIRPLIVLQFSQHRVIVLGFENLLIHSFFYQEFLMIQSTIIKILMVTWGKFMVIEASMEASKRLQLISSAWRVSWPIKHSCSASFIPNPKTSRREAFHKQWEPIDQI